MKSVEQLLDECSMEQVASIDSICKGVGVISLHETIDLTEFGSSIGLRPIPHDAEGTILWDVKPSSDEPSGQLPRSQTFDEFTWHTDASFESMPPRYFMLQVLRESSDTGGLQSFISADALIENLDESDIETLTNKLYTWRIPLEFRKADSASYLPILFSERANSAPSIRYRAECLEEEGLPDPQGEALQNLQSAIDTAPTVVHQPHNAEIILVDNHHILHARSGINDPERHLQRVRFR